MEQIRVKEENNYERQSIVDILLVLGYQQGILTLSFIYLKGSGEMSMMIKPIVNLGKCLILQLLSILQQKGLTIHDIIGMSKWSVEFIPCQIQLQAMIIDIDLYPILKVEFLMTQVSNYSLPMEMRNKDQNLGWKPFRFFNVWTKHPNFVSFV